MIQEANKNMLNTLARVTETARQREAAQVIHLPVWPEAKRGTPNSFLRSALFSAIQSKDRFFIDGQILASQEGITVKYTGQQLNQEDLTLWETLVHLAKEHPLGNVCSFTAYSILKSLGLPNGGEQHRQLHKGIMRLNATSINITHEGKTYFGSLIKSGVKDDNTNHYTIELNRELIRLYGQTQWTLIDWQQRQKLRRKPLAQALHAYYSSHQAPYAVKLNTLRRLTGSRNQQAAGFKRLVRAALDKLVEIDFLQSYSIDGDIVSVQRVPSE